MNSFLRLIALSVFGLWLAGFSSAHAQGVDVLAKQKARNIRDANNAQQGVTPAQPGAPAPGTGAASGTNTPRGIDPSQQARIDKLAEDILQIKPGTKVTLDMRTQIETDALALAKGSAKPGQTLTNLVRHLSAALSGNGVALKDTGPALLARAINVVVNSMNLSSSQVQPVIIQARNTLMTSGVNEEDYKTVVADLNALVAEIQKNKAKAQ